MIDECYMKTLLNDCEGYPEDIRELFDKSHLNFSFNGAFLDLRNELLVKLSEGGKVIEAHRGFGKLSGIFKCSY